MAQKCMKMSHCRIDGSESVATVREIRQEPRNNHNIMKKSLTFLGGMLMAASITASPDIRFSLETSPDAVNLPFVQTATSDFTWSDNPSSKQADLMVPVSHVTSIVTPEPTTASLLLVAFACGLRQLRRRNKV